MDSSVATNENSPDPEFQDKYPKPRKPDEEKFESGQKREEDINFTKDETTPVTSDTAFTAIEQPACELNGFLWALVVAAIISPFFLFVLDNTIVADVQPKVVETLGEIAKLPWMSVAFALGAVSVNLICLVGLTWGLGTVLGPIIGDAFTDSGATWRWSFDLNTCVGGSRGPVYILLLPSHDPRPGVSIKTRLREI
ncbi:putative mfs drug efflux protein [Botrytis fragariae]|uniref:Putative mfs drug efflux protein n=1 Tax=Botrytis fragariae TaxID=1964551 RepID=A0A8H6AWY4_9HELO|nr:putative mfs drug efflux protein [Botrytis fragariae]KAF5874915.1 putative mfs drug efflux protein [Botrytis fragariae]